MRKNTHSAAVDQLFDAVLGLKDSVECYTFFEHICLNSVISSISG